MNTNDRKQKLERLADELAPGKVNLWPAIQEHFETSTLHSYQGAHPMNTTSTQNWKKRWIGAVALVIFILGVALFATPQGRALAQEALRFFTRAESDTLPLQTWQMTPALNPELPVAVQNEPIITTPIPELSETAPTEAPALDPASILDAQYQIQEVEKLAGYPVREPDSSLIKLDFSGASFEADRQIVRIFYGDNMNGLVLREEQFTQSNDCELCGTVGASAEVQSVQIGDVLGEYVVGVWNLTENGPVWKPDPYLQTMRWQVDGMAFELLFMGQPDNMSKEQMVAIAESLK